MAKTADGVTIRKVRVSELMGFVDEFAHSSEEQILSPITSHRARAHACNPCAAPDDPALIVASIAGRMVGYQGLLPGLFWTGTNVHKVIWCTTMYVAPEYRKQLIALRIIKEMLGMPFDFCVAGITEDNARLFRQFGFQAPGDIPYLVMNFQQWAPLSSSMARINQSLSSLPWVWRLARLPLQFRHYILMPFAHLRLRKHRQHSPCRSGSPFSAEPVCKLPDSSTNDSIQATFVRPPSVVNWMLEMPWIKESRIAADPPYEFSDIRSKFNYFAYRLSSTKSDRSGYVVFSESLNHCQTVIKMLDIRGSLKDKDVYFSLALDVATSRSADQLHLPSDFKTAVLARPDLRAITEDRTHNFLVRLQPHSPLSLVLDRIKADVVDGDLAFF